MGPGFDLIGDVHGMHRTLLALLERLGWSRSRGTWQGPPDRRLVFLGDLLDRGPLPLDCLELAETLVGQGQALMVLGNHELNALHFMAGHRPLGKRYQMHTTWQQIQASPARWDRAAAFLETVPTRLELDGGHLRVVHACWHEDLATLPLRLDSAELVRETSLTPDCGAQGTSVREGRYAWAAERCLKGPEQPARQRYRDASGKWRDDARQPWWEDYPPEAPLVVFGHYKFPWAGDPDPASPGRPVPEPGLVGPGRNAVCLDYGAERGDPLTAWRYPAGEFVRQEGLDPLPPKTPLPDGSAPDG